MRELRLPESQASPETPLIRSNAHHRVPSGFSGLAADLSGCRIDRHTYS
jgi:hypothetical protein